MDSAPDFLNLFIEPTGELVYFLVVIAISQSAMLMALSQRLRGTSEVAAGRYTLLLGGVVLAWLMMGIGALYALIADVPDEAILPPLERAVNAMVIVLTAVALLSADSDRAERGLWGAATLVGVALIAFYAYSAHTWYSLADTEYFNEHDLGFIWTFVSGLLLIAAMALLLFHYGKTADIPLKLTFFIVLLAGYSYTLIQSRTDNLEEHSSGALRLAFLAGTPLIATVIYRLVINRLNVAIDEVSEYAEAVSRPFPSVRSDDARPAVTSGAYMSGTESMTLLTALGLMLENEDPDSIPRQIVVAVATVTRADITVLIAYDDEQWADVIAAYDHARKRDITGLAINLDQQPTVKRALEEKTQQVLHPDRNQDELVDLYTRLDISELGPAYIQPLTRSRQVVGGLIVALPFSDRDLQDNEITLLEGLGPIAARLLLLSQNAKQTRSAATGEAIQAIVEGAGTDSLDADSVLAARREMQQSLEMSQQQIAELSKMVRDLQVELDYERGRMAMLFDDSDQAMTISQRIEVLSDERQQLATERQRLSQALQEAQATLVSATSDRDEDVYASMIESLERERDELQVQKNKMERHLEDIRQAREQPVPEVLSEFLAELGEDKARLAAERNQLKNELDDVMAQLQSLGIEGGPLAVAKALGTLTEERKYYRTAAEKIAQERDLLLQERVELEERIAHESEREAQLVALEADIRRLATDREAIISQRDNLRNENEEMSKTREKWIQQRARMLGEITGLQAELEDVTFQLSQSNSKKADLQAARATLESERDRLIAEQTAIKTERDQLLARVEGNRELLEQLGTDGVGTLQSMIQDLTRERETLEARLAATEKEVELARHLHSRPPGGSTTQATSPIVPDNADVILSITQELRTPMSSIMGYTDLLLSESVGILGALQRQFIQRVQANINRLSNLLHDLISITALDSEAFQFEAVTIDMLEVVEDAITATGTQFREKGITLHMNLANDLPEVRADRDAMNQITMQLLSNAYLASPPDSEVTIAAQFVKDYVPPVDPEVVEVGPPADMIHIMITDQGGGIPPHEQRRVFGRFYRADNPLIEGVGDTGVGLSIAKALVEAHHGVIWLESVLGRGSTFHFAIPLTPPTTATEEV
ncbi:MAG: hypothetical protein JW966_09780 [Anaerolineae bacterium]|nr:hypothetical protein [Anaerolineae bacterium]